MKSSNVIHHPGYDGNAFSTVEDEIEDIRAAVPSSGAPGSDSGVFYDESEGAAGYFTPTDGLEFNGTNLRLTANQRISAIGLEIDGGGQAILTGVKTSIIIPFACTITGWWALADLSGSIVIDIWKDVLANYPPTNDDSITASAPVTISAATNASDTTLTGWTTTVAAGDILRFKVDSASTLTHLDLILRVTRT